jgi:hypothetical protein
MELVVTVEKGEEETIDRLVPQSMPEVYEV